MRADNEEQPRSEVLTLLRSTGLFDTLDESSLEKVEAALEPVRLAGGEFLFREGDAGDSLYVVIYGRLAVTVAREEGREEVVGEIGRGEVVGEMAVLTGEPRSATVRAVRDTQLVRFSKEAFEHVALAQPPVMMLVAKRIVTRLRRMNKGLPATNLKTVAVAPLAREVPCAEFCRRLVDSLSQIGSTLHVNSASIEKDFGRGAADSATGDGRSKLSAWLDEQEAKYAYIVYESDAECSPWTDLCMRQADRILMLAPGGGPTAGGTTLDEIERLCAGKTATRRELVLIHGPDVERPAGAAQWLDRIGFADTHHNFRLHAQADCLRLARLLTGRAVGLVLGGGGARGLAHVGVIRAFVESGVPIDVIGGTSMGSVIAAQYALGMDVDTMLEVNRKGWIESDPFKDKTIPVMALLACRKLDRMLDTMFGNATIEDLWLTYFCVSANLTQADTVVHRRGGLAQSVRASLAIPGVALPVCRDGDLLVDGGVLNNLPGDVMRKVCGGSVAVVDVSPQKDLSVDPSYRKAPSSWQVLFSRINPFAKSIEVPGVLAIMTRTLMLASQNRSNAVARDADLYIRPSVEQFGIFEWKSLDGIVDAGYQRGMKAIEEWRSAPGAG